MKLLELDQIKFSVLPQIPVELVVVGWCLPPEAEVKDERLKIKEKEQIVVDQPRQTERPQQQPKEPIANHDERIAKDETSPHGALFSPTSKPDNFLAAFLGRLKQDNHSIAGVLRGCKLVEIRPNEVVFETKFKFHRDKLMEAKTASVLDSRASELLAEKIKVVVNLTEK